MLRTPTTLRLASLVAAGAMVSACASDPGPARPTASPSSPESSEVTAPDPPPDPLVDAIRSGGDDPAAARADVRLLLARGVDTAGAADLASSLGLDGLARLVGRADDPLTDPGASLLRAASSGDADAAALALRAGARVEVRDERRRTPLLLAVIDDRLEVAALLTALGADPDAVDAQQDTPWLVTGVTGSVAMGQLLLPLDPDVTLRNRYGGVSIIPASERGHVAYVRWALQNTDIDVDHVNDLGWTALLEAVVLGEGTVRWQRIVAILLRNGADPTIPDRDGVSALAHARSKGYDEIAALLSR